MGQEIGTLDAGHDPGRILRMNLEIASVSQSETNSHMGQLRRMQPDDRSPALGQLLTSRSISSNPCNRRSGVGVALKRPPFALPGLLHKGWTWCQSSAHVPTSPSLKSGIRK